jgi:POTRA domain, FtsQ-type
MVRTHARPVAHRRIARRRKPVNRRKINKLRLALWIAVLVLLGECVVVALVSPRFRVKALELEGVATIPTHKIAAQFAVPATQNLFLAPTADWASAITRLPGIERATIKKTLPGKLTVQVTERTPWATVRTFDGHWHTIDSNLIPFRTTKEPEAGLVRILVSDCAPWEALPGIVLPSVGIETAQECVRWSLDYRNFPLKQIEIDKDSKVCLVSQGGVLVKLGSGEKIPQKLQSLEQLLVERPDLKGNAPNLYVNLFAFDAPAVGLINPNTLTQTKPQIKP